MYRSAIEQMSTWKSRKGKKPLLIRGARQVGKTWLMREFARTAYSDSVYVNFDNNLAMKELFSADMQVGRLITGLELYAGRKIEPGSTLLIFDEIQEVPQALTSLKYFHENGPQYDIVCAGSLMGVALHKGTSFPVGKVEFLDLHPLSFTEYMLAMGKERFVELLTAGDFEMAGTFKQEYIDLLKSYYFIGGMPEAVASYVQMRDLNEVREIHRRILTAYELDFSKHAPNEVVPRIRMLWNSIPSSLARENKKFVYGHVKEGARARDYELAMLWLADCGLIHKVHRVTTASLPLKAYEDKRAFKLYLLDVGLLACMTGLGSEVLLSGNELFREFKGALTEQFVLQQLKAMKDINCYYWSNDGGNAEVDFLIDIGAEIVPIEVKAELNLKAKSLKTYCEKFSPQLAVRTSMTDYKQEQWLLNLPLWAIETIQNKNR
ncbi:MAG: ATP-binding protein [Sedimentisphaerales bacterium]|nr:ATP-binding protein [Sedimentisphaerales bacterium]MBN2843282.1 ATP-binding protein [Sedimentisphaerales bacterium]